MITGPAKEQLADNNTGEDDGTKILSGVGIGVSRAVDLFEKKVYGTANLSRMLSVKCAQH